MAATHVHSVEWSALQTVSWSQDDRIAVSADKEIIILKLDASPSSSTGFHVRVKVRSSTDDLMARQHNPWTALDRTLLLADRRVRSSFLKRWTYSSLAGEDQVSTAWSRLAWSPVGVGMDNRSVLAALTRDHRIHIFGQSSHSILWTQLADLGDQLILHHHDDFVSQYQSLKSHNKCLTTICSQMLSVAAVELAWSTVFQGPGEGGKEGQFVLLFVAMNNGDVVTWKINLPLTGLECCSIVGRQPASTDSTVTSLAWTTLADNPSSGLLAVGYTDGGVELQQYQCDADARCRGTLVLASHKDYMPVSSLTWATAQQVGLVLLCTKEQITSAYTVSAGHHGSGSRGEELGEKDGGQQQQLCVKGSCHTRLGNWLPASGVQCKDNTTVMGAEDGTVVLLSIAGSAQEPEIKCGQKLPLQLDEAGWGCVGVHLSSNAFLCVTLFRPNFPFNYLSSRFRFPVQVHICLVPTADRTTVEQVLAPDKVAALSACRTDVLEFARHMLCEETISTATVVSLTQRLLASPYTDTIFGWRVARHMLSTLCSLCKSRKLAPQVESVDAAVHHMTERLLCRQIRAAWNRINSDRPHITLDKDLPVFNTMLNWVTSSSQRTEALGSEVMHHLTSTVSQSQPDTCVLCDSVSATKPAAKDKNLLSACDVIPLSLFSEYVVLCWSVGQNVMDYSGSAVATCANKHSFGLCCHTMSVCDKVPYQCCSTCGALALSAKQLKGFQWLPGDPNTCTLCGSYLYSTNTALRF